MRSTRVIIRDPSVEDESAWRSLWAGYSNFYETLVQEAVTQRTWDRILDPSSTMFARLAENEGRVIGFVICILHEGTWTFTPICYLEDLFVESASRRLGAARLMIEDVIARAREKLVAGLLAYTRQ
jgi:GNAT superfamily N-acetyltransferase